MEKVLQIHREAVKQNGYVMFTDVLLETEANKDFPSILAGVMNVNMSELKAMIALHQVSAEDFFQALQ